MADANPNGGSGVHKRAAGKDPVSNATTQILQVSGKVIVTVTAGAQTPRAATARTTVGAESGRIGAGVIPVMIVMIVAAPTGARTAPTGVTGKITGENAATIVMTAGNLAGSASVLGGPPIVGGRKMRQVPAVASTGVASALIVITAGTIAEMIGGRNAGSGKRRHLAPESILSGCVIPATAPKNGAMITNRRSLRQ